MAVDLVPWTRVAVLVAFSLLAVSALLGARRTGSAGRWIAAAFGFLALVLLGGWLPDLLDVDLPTWLDRLRIAALLTFPYLMVRFTASFAPFPPWLEAATATAAATAVVAAAVAVPANLAPDERPDWSATFVSVLLLYWVALSLLSVARLWRAGRGQPTVSRRRVRLMSAGVAVLALALLLAGRVPDPALRLAVNLTALLSAGTFWLGFTPPRALRLVWRQPEEEQLRTGTMAILEATTPEQLAAGLLQPTVRLVGGEGAVLVDPQGRVVASHGKAPQVGATLSASEVERPRESITLGESRGDLVVWTSPYAPFFGREEGELLRSMATVAALALERVELLEEERASHAVLEQAQREAEEAQRAAERAREEASLANTAKTEFLARMSHELRTPLNAILGFGQLLEHSELSEEDRQGVAYILKGGRHLLDLINEVLDLAGIEAGMLTLSLEPVHAGELIHDTLAMIQPLVDTRGIELSAETATCDAHVMTDRQRSRQVLLNLLSNAVKYNRDGGQVRVSCGPAPRGALRISVTDTGPGIATDRVDRIFDPFDRLGAEHSGVEGTGLGLALSKQLMDRLGGDIGVETAIGKGSTFWIDLPVTDAPTADVAPREEPAPAGEQSSRTLLLVEDNLANLKVVEAMLRRRPGITVLPAMQGQIALELAYEHRPDVIVLDLHLPDIPGRELLHRLRADPRTRDIPVLIASADASPRRVDQLRDEGAFAYLTKPLELDPFLSAIDEAIEGHARTTGAGRTEDG